jgi:hypothetical protein
MSIPIYDSATKSYKQETVKNPQCGVCHRLTDNYKGRGKKKWLYN